MQRLKVGRIRIDLAQVVYIQEMEPEDWQKETVEFLVQAFFSGTCDEQGMPWIRFVNDAARLVCAAWDGDEEEVARLLPIVNGAPEPDEPVCPRCNGRMAQLYGGKSLQCRACQYVLVSVS